MNKITIKDKGRYIEGTIMELDATGLNLGGGGGDAAASNTLVVASGSVNLKNNGTTSLGAIDTGGLRFFPTQISTEILTVTGYVPFDGDEGTPVFSCQLNRDGVALPGMQWDFTDDTVPSTVHGSFTTQPTQYVTMADGNVLSITISNASRSTTHTARFIVVGYLA